MTVFIQFIGLIATALVAVTYIYNSRETMLFLQFSSSILFAVHYLLLSAYTGAILSLLVSVRCFIYWKWEKNKGVVFIFILLFVLFGIVSWQNVFSILPTLGSVLFSLAFWFKSPKQIRLLSAPASLFWGNYGILTGSWGGISSEILCLMSIVIGYLKHDYRVIGRL